MASTPSFDAAIEKYLSSMQRDFERDLSESTISTYSADLVKFGEWLQETLEEYPPVDLINRRDIRDFRDYLLSKDQMPSTINRCITVAKGFFDWCIDKSYCNVNPCKGLRRIEQVEAEPKSLGKDEMRKVANVLSKNRRNSLIFTGLIETAIRVSELCNLKHKDIELFNPPRRSKAGVNLYGYLTVRLGKGKKRRTVPISEILAGELSDYYEHLEKSDVSYTPEDYLVTSRTNQRMTRQAIEAVLRRASRKAGLDDDVYPHQCRHTAAKKWMAKTSNNIATVQKLMGHASGSTTMIYLTPTEEDLAEAVS